ncbi:MAG: glycosyltransferase [Thermoguttaceae bacterium]
MHSEPHLWLYWEGPMPAYIRLCADLLLAYHPDAVLLGPDDLPALGFSEEVLAAIAKWHVCQRSDAIRTMLLAAHGGMWCDIDCIPLRSFRHFARLAERSPSGIAAYDSTDNTIGVGFFAARSGGSVISRLDEHVRRVVGSGRSPGWLEVSSEPMTQIVREVGREQCPIIPLEQVAPISWRDMRLFGHRDSDANHRQWVSIRPSTYCFMLSNQVLGSETDVHRLTRHELLTSDRLISFLFRESFARLEAMQAAPLASGKAVMAINLYEDDMPENVRASQRAAAERWGAEYVEITRPRFGWQDAYLEKLHLDYHAAAYERVVYLDRDVIVRADCPNLFDATPETHLGAVASEQDGHRLLVQIQPKMDPICRRIGVPMEYTTEYINSGVLVFGPHVHRPAFEAARCLHGLTPERCWEVYDQGCLGLGIKWSGTPLHRLPSQFNRCGERLWKHWTPKMDCYVWHFCGKKDRQSMQSTNWQDVG